MTSAIGIIPPEVSRHVHVIMTEGAAPWAGVISAVRSDRRISVAAFTENGNNCALPDIHLRQPDEAVPLEYPCAQWMPYSVKQAGLVQAEPQPEVAVDPTPVPGADTQTASDAEQQSQS